MIPNAVTNEIGSLTISLLIFPKSKQDKLVIQKNNGDISSKFSPLTFIFIQSL